MFDLGHRCAWVENEAALAAELADAREGGTVVVGGLDVDADEIGAGLGEGLDVFLRLGEHQVRVEEQFRAGATQRRESCWTEGQVGHEMTVHDVAVQPDGPGLRDRRRAIGEMGVVAGEQGRGEYWSMKHGAGDGLQKTEDGKGSIISFRRNFQGPAPAGPRPVKKRALHLSPRVQHRVRRFLGQ